MRPEVLTLLAVLVAAPAVATPPISLDSITVETTKKVRETPPPDPTPLARSVFRAPDSAVDEGVQGISNSPMHWWYTLWTRFNLLRW